MPPETSYAKNGDLSIAYQVVGGGPFDLVFVTGFVSHLDLEWADPDVAAFFGGLSRFSRLILYDKRGVGLSDPVNSIPTLEDRMDDLRAVMDAAQSQTAVVFGISEGGPMCALFAATYPERTRALVLYGTFSRWAPRQYPRSAAAYDRFEESLTHWGRGDSLQILAPSIGSNPVRTRMWGMFERAGASPAMVRAFIKGLENIDVTDVLPGIRVPTLVLHRSGDVFPIEDGRRMAELIPGSRFIELSGDDHLPWAGDTPTVLAEVEEFLTGAHQDPAGDRALATILLPILSVRLSPPRRWGTNAGVGPWMPTMSLSEPNCSVFVAVR